MSHSTAAATGCIIFLFYSRGHLWSSFYLQLPNRLNAYETRLCVGATNSANSPTYRRIPLTAQHASQFRVAAAWFQGLLNITLPLGSTMTLLTWHHAKLRVDNFRDLGDSQTLEIAGSTPWPASCVLWAFLLSWFEDPGKRQTKTKLTALAAPAPFLWHGQRRWPSSSAGSCQRRYPLYLARSPCRALEVLAYCRIVCRFESSFVVWPGPTKFLQSLSLDEQLDERSSFVATLAKSKRSILGASVQQNMRWIPFSVLWRLHA